MALYKKINNVLKEASPDYAKATKYIENSETYKKAFHQGVNAHKKHEKVSATVVQRQLNALTDADKTAYRLGYASQMYEKIQKANINWQNEEKIMRLLAGEEQDKLKVLAGTPEVLQEFLKKMRYVSDMDARAKRLIGSQTQAMQEVRKDLSVAPTVPGRAISSFQKLRSGAPQSAATLNDILENEAAKMKAAGMSAHLDPMGEQHLRESIKRLEAERRRATSEVRERAMYPGLIPSLLSPYDRVREKFGFGLLD